MINFVRMWLFLKIKNIVNLWKICFFENEAVCESASVWKYFIPRMYIIIFNTLTYCLSGLGKRILCNTFQAPFPRKQGCSEVYFLLWNYLKMFPTILDMKNANRKQKKNFFFQNSTNKRMTYFNVSAVLKRRGDNNT